MTVRPACRGDLSALIDIYNHYVETDQCTFDTEPFDEMTRMPWWSQFDSGRHQCWVHEDDAAITGYACSMPFKAKPAYETSVEVSVYVRAGAGGRGIGRSLYDVLLPRLGAEDLHRAYAGIALPNNASIALHEGFDFHKVSHLTEVGRKFGRYWDVAWYERAL